MLSEKNKKSRLLRYWPRYKVSNIVNMVRNSFKKPDVYEGDFIGRTVVITGATSGIGYYTAIKYAQMGANIVAVNRNEQKSAELKKYIEETYNVSVDYIVSDQSVLDDVRNAAEELAKLKRIDVLIHNAGLFLEKKAMTQDNMETTFVVNYLSSFIINFILKERLREQGDCRIIFVSSEGHRFAPWGLDMDDLFWEKRRYSGLKAYGAAKTAQLLSMLIFAEYFEGSSVVINAMHPGMVVTNSGHGNSRFYKWYKRNFIDRFSSSPELSAEALYYLGVSPDVVNINGKFFNYTTLEEPAPPAVDRDAAIELWEKSLELAGLCS
ncbi:SDR family NAD(P)-dependent oxidoreductase [Spirochaetia bacterium 38H-sp]|uniref:SDR family NAD(P)-dependent oxidoreductase n=1 Tax=Rarispira pelagica TaxID=3141764 RepID=A0ABU9UC85_9SPIR